MNKHNYERVQSAANLLWILLDLELLEERVVSDALGLLWDAYYNNFESRGLKPH